MERILKLIRSFGGAGNRSLTKLTPTGWLLFAVPLVVMLAFLLSIGPTMQNAVFSALGSDAPDLYSAAYDNAITRFPSLLDWMSEAFNGQYLVIAIAVVVVSIHTSSMRAFIAVTAISSAALLMFVDIAGALILGNLSVSFLVTNLVANAIGGVVIGFLTGAALALFRVTGLCLGLGNPTNLTIAAMFVVGLGAAVSAGAYLALRLLYQPLPVDVAMVLGSPVDGAYATQFKGPATKPERSFDFVPDGKVYGAASARSIEGAVTAHWQRAIEAVQYDVEIHLMGECSHTTIKDLTPGAPLVSKRDVKSIAVGFDKGMSEFQVAPGDNRQFTFENISPTMFWLDRDRDGVALKVTQYMQGGTLAISSSAKIAFMISAPLATMSKEQLAPSPRVLTINIDGRDWRGTFASHGTREANEKIVCRAVVPPDYSIEKVEIDLESKYSDIGALVTITPSSTRTIYYTNPETSLTLNGVNGWASITDLNATSLERGGSGRLSFLSARGAVSDVEVDGIERDIKPYDTVFMFGDFRGEFIKSGGVKVSGKARSLWKNLSRVNLTRWEKLPVEWQLALFTSVAAAIGAVGAFARWAWPRIRPRADEDVKTWA